MSFLILSKNIPTSARIALSYALSVLFLFAYPNKYLLIQILLNINICIDINQYQYPWQENCYLTSC